jgi:hypothetical protein
MQIKRFVIASAWMLMLSGSFVITVQGLKEE